MKINNMIKLVILFFAAFILTNNVKVQAASYSIVRFYPDKVAYLYPSTTSTSSYTSIATSYGSDAAYLGSDTASGRVKIRISGYTGWIPKANVKSIDLVSSLNAPQVKVTATSLNIRSLPSTSGAKVGVAYNGSIYRYYETKVAEGFTWYRIGTSQWIANNAAGTYLTAFTGSSLTTYYVKKAGMLYHYFAYYSGTTLKQQKVLLGTGPQFLTEDVIYYSFDGNYFYNDLNKMMPDYINGKFTSAINPTTPFYAYYMYLPTRSKTGYNASVLNSVISNKGYTRNKPTFIAAPDIRYVLAETTVGASGNVTTYNRTSEDISNMSLMYGVGQDFINAANQYGVNALMMFGTALNESAIGTSKLAFYKNNIFGLGAIDSDPMGGARSYNNVTESIADYAKFTGDSSSSYNNPVSDKYYYGTHYGNKGSGMNIKYATDPYWGEKQAGNSFNNDSSYGGYDNFANIIGITNKLDVNLYKEPGGSILYTLKNNLYGKSIYNIPVIVFDKVSQTVNGVVTNWYKVYTDTALDTNRNVANITYDFNTSYGYIKETDLYISNQAAILASDKSIPQYVAFDPKVNVAAFDSIDGNITSKITVTNNTVDINTQGTYSVTYSVANSYGKVTEKTIAVTVIKNADPVITASDQKVYVNTTYNPQYGVTAKDTEQGNVTNLVTVTSNNVDMTTIGTYNVTYAVTDAANNKVEKTISVEVMPRPANVNGISSYITRYNGVSLYWAAAPNTSFYEIYFATSKYGTYVKVGTSTKNSFYHGGLISGRTYYYKVRSAGALNGTTVYGDLTSPATIYIKPSTPSTSVKRMASTTLRVYSSTVAGASGYEYYVATSARGTYSRIATTSRTYYTKYSLRRQRYYYFKVRAYRIVNSRKIYSDFSSPVRYYLP